MVRSDEELVRLCQDSHKEAFDELVERYWRRIFSYVASQIGDLGAAEDVVQESFFRAWIALDRCGRPSEFAGWLFMIAKDQCYKWLRKNRRSFHAPWASLHRQAKSQLQQEPRDDILDLQEAISNLPEHQRLALTLRHQEGLSFKEIAKIMGKPMGTITSWIFRAYETLREKLGAEG
jgi:RNA polymerase sigma-70 factor (ECF subfamily)